MHQVDLPANRCLDHKRSISTSPCRTSSTSTLMGSMDKRLIISYFITSCQFSIYLPDYILPTDPTLSSSVNRSLSLLCYGWQGTGGKKIDNKKDREELVLSRAGTQTSAFFINNFYFFFVTLLSIINVCYFEH